MRKLVFITAAVVALAFQAHAASAADPVFDPAKLADHVKVLASDAFEGRGPATRAEPKTVDYLVEQFKAAGLRPGGDKAADGSRAWTQDVPLARFEITGPITASAKVGDKTFAWSQGDQVTVRAAATGATRVAIEDAPLVFIGYGVDAPERGWDDFKGYDLKGKVALVLVNDPDFETGRGAFGGKAMTYYGRWTYKYEEAARRGAIGFLVIHETAPAAYGWATVKNSNASAVFDIIRDDPTKAHAPLEGWIQRDAAADLLKAAGLDYEALKISARSPQFRPVPLPGATVSMDYAVKAETIVTRNVAALLAGTTHPDETVIYTAHWDHLGIGEPDAKGDVIYNGARDNGTGVAALIELAVAFAKAPKTTRSVLFLSVTAEEKGLLGSEYYAWNPLYPLATTVGVVNMDSLSVAGPAHDFATAGDAPLTLQDDLIAVGREHGRYFSPDPRPQNGSFFRSDHFSFAKRGVPAISFGTGEDLLVGGKAAGAAAQQDYISARYHQPADEWSPDWNLAGVAADMGLLYELGEQLANSREWPSWKPGAEFKAERDKSAAARK
ncbi:M28 family metallopeptidase [Phenylobacterium sp.]|uniref:M28 family metallopeptidase n=1 Tax=Phenylobacterium sp. TaxID=1871053 RepID=UPI002732CE4C|nr:M28 family metallopeptidase [Phenylobacterium sp.]MDP3660746.1 M28 family metallopeptidase [Phenylobacterium sp.]